MPIFEYRCRHCGSKFEFYHRGKELPVCPSCGSKELSKLFSTFNSRVKGGSREGGFGARNGGGGGSSCSTCSGGSCATCK